MVGNFKECIAEQTVFALFAAGVQFSGQTAMDAADQNLLPAAP